MERRISTAEIVAIRKGLDLSQEDFAHLLGCTVSTVNRWEAGLSRPNRLSVRAIRAAAKPQEPAA